MKEFICIDVTLSYFNFGKGTSCNVATANLKFCRKLFLCHISLFAKHTYVVSEAFFIVCIHSTSPFLYPN